MGNQGDRQLGNQEAIKLKLDEYPEQLDAPDQAISGNQWQSVAISGNEWPSVAIIGNHRLPNSTMLFSPLAKPRGPTICERPTLGDLPWPGEPISTLPPRHISKVGTLRHEKMRRAITSAEVIRGHRRSSEVIRGHQRSSEVIRGHQRSSEAIRGHQRASVVISGHQRSSEAISPLSKANTLLARVLSLNQRQAAPIDSAIRAINRVAINRHQSQSFAISRTWSTRRSQSVAISRNQSHLVHEALAISRNQSQSVAPGPRGARAVGSA